MSCVDLPRAAQLPLPKHGKMEASSLAGSVFVLSLIRVSVPPSNRVGSKANPHDPSVTTTGATKAFCDVMVPQNY